MGDANSWYFVKFVCKIKRIWNLCWVGGCQVFPLDSPLYNYFCVNSSTLICTWICVMYICTLSYSPKYFDSIQHIQTLLNFKVFQFKIHHRWFSVCNTREMLITDNNLFLIYQKNVHIMQPLHNIRLEVCLW